MVSCTKKWGRCAICFVAFMSEEDEESVDFVSLGSTPRELEAMGYSRTTSTCNRDECDGKQWFDNHNTVCAQCSTVTSTSKMKTMTRGQSVWEQFRTESEKYRNSRRVRMVGGFGSTYPKVDDDEVYESVTELRVEYHL